MPCSRPPSPAACRSRSGSPRPESLWPAWKLEGAALEAAKLDATILAIKLQEDAGIDIVSDGEQARVHFVHGFLANLDGIDFERRQVIGIRADRYKADVPTVTGPIRRKGPCTARKPEPPAPIPGASSNSLCPGR